MAIKQLLDYCAVILKLSLIISNKKYNLNQIKIDNVERKRNNFYLIFNQP